MMGWNVSVIDSKATWSTKVGRYMKSKSAEEGFSDIVGNTKEGIAVYLELKAPKNKTIRFKQKRFLIPRILNGCIAGPVRSTAELMALIKMNATERLNWLHGFRVVD